jgi:hypothetical protein
MAEDGNALFITEYQLVNTATYGETMDQSEKSLDQ